MPRRFLIPIAATILLAAGGGGVWFFQIQTYHFAVVRDGVLYRDGNRDLREFTHAVSRSHAKTVVSLIDDRELNDPAKHQFGDEAAWCASHGIHQIRIPVKLGGWPTTGDVQTFLSLARNPADQPVLVHCAQGVRRTGMFVAAFQLSVEHQRADQVKAQMKSFGHSANDLADVGRFIDLFNPADSTLPTTMPASSGE